MVEYTAFLGTFFGKLTRSLKDQIVSDVPPEDALCEFDCRKGQCQHDQWLHCPNRLSYLALEAGLTAPTPNEQADASIEVCPRGQRLITNRLLSHISIAGMQERQISEGNPAEVTVRPIVKDVSHIHDGVDFRFDPDSVAKVEKRTTPKISRSRFSGDSAAAILCGDDTKLRGRFSDE